MPLSLIRRELRGAFIYFIPVGTVVDGGTVSKTAWPDASPATNYTDWAFEDIESVAIEIESETENFDVPMPSGGYDKDEEKTIVGRKWVAKTAKTNNLIKQLENGLSSPAAAGVSQKPLANRAGTIEGVLLIEIVGKATSGVIERTQTWARMSVKTPAGAEKATSKLEVEFKQLESSLNTYIAL